MVSDSGGFDDKSFTQTSYAGLVNAKEKHGLKTAEVESKSDAEYDGYLKELVNADCNPITTVGFKLQAQPLNSPTAKSSHATPIDAPTTTNRTLQITTPDNT